MTLRRTATRPAAAFTLIELLVVIGIVALLVSILAPALGAARRHAGQVRELSALRQLGIGFNQYGVDNAGRVMPGYLRASWVRPGSATRDFAVWDHPDDARDATRLWGSVVRRYPWRMMPYLNFAWDALILDRSRLSQIRALPDRPADDTGFQAALATNPSFGMNTSFVGGDAHRGAFYKPSLLRWGAYYVKKLEQPLFPDQLIVFGTARGDRQGSRGYDPVPGYHRLDGPWHPSETDDTVPTFIPWTAPGGPFDPSQPTAAYGHVDCRFGGKAAMVMFDGHAATLSLEQLYDMRRWSNQATSADWQP